MKDYIIKEMNKCMMLNYVKDEIISIELNNGNKLEDKEIVNLFVDIITSERDYSQDVIFLDGNVISFYNSILKKGFTVDTDDDIMLHNVRRNKSTFHNLGGILLSNLATQYGLFNFFRELDLFARKVRYNRLHDLVVSYVLYVIEDNKEVGLEDFEKEYVSSYIREVLTKNYCLKVYTATEERCLCNYIKLFFGHDWSHNLLKTITADSRRKKIEILLG